MPGKGIFDAMNDENRNTHKNRRLFNHQVARHTARNHIHPGDRANASEMAQAAILRYDERTGLTKRALPKMNYSAVGKFKLHPQGEKELAKAVRAHRILEMSRKREENAALEPKRKAAQKASREAHKRSEKEVDVLTGMMKAVNPFKGGRRRTRRRRRSTRA